MRASELAAKLLEWAAEHDDPGVYSLSHSSDCAQAVEPESIELLDLGYGGSMVIVIAGMTMAEFQKAHEAKSVAVAVP